MAFDPPPQDPLDFMKNMWSSMGFALPGMAAPTLDLDELDKRIKDMKAVEGWLKLNLNTLQMSIQGLEMQRATVAAMQAMSQSAGMSAASNAGGSADNKAAPPPPFANPALWPWNLMQPTPAPAAAPAPAPAPSPAAENPTPRSPKAKK